MTGLIYSLALGFLIFLSVACRMQISFNSHEQLKEHGATFMVKAIEDHDLRVAELEEIFSANQHIVSEFSWVTAPMH